VWMVTKECGTKLRGSDSPFAGNLILSKQFLISDGINYTNLESQVHYILFHVYLINDKMAGATVIYKKLSGSCVLRVAH
jgi:hypothetical protein